MRRIDDKSAVKIKVPSHYTTAVLAHQQDLLKYHMSEEARSELMTGFESVELTSTEHRALFGIFRIYNEKGLSDEVIRSGVTFTPYELCKYMGYKCYGSSSFPGSARHEAISALNSLSGKRYRCLFTVRRNPATQRINVVAIPNKAILEVSHRFEGMSIDEIQTRFEKASPEQISAKVCEQLIHSNFWRPMDLDFYDRLRACGVRVSPEHWLLQYWLARAPKDCRTSTFDELRKVLKLDRSKTHRSRQRAFVLRLFVDFQKAGYLLKVKLDCRGPGGQLVDCLQKNMRRY